MTLKLPYNVELVKPGHVFPAGRLNAYTTMPGEQALISVSDKGVTLHTKALDTPVQGAYLTKRLAGLHTTLRCTNGAGMTAEQHKAYEEGAVLIGSIQPRNLLSDVIAPNGPDDVAFCLFACVPLRAYLKGGDTLGHEIRYYHAMRAIQNHKLIDVSGVAPLVRGMSLCRDLPWLGVSTGKVLTSSQIWELAQYNVMLSQASTLLFDPYMPYGAGLPLVKKITPKAVRDHFENEDEL